MDKRNIYRKPGRLFTLLIGILLSASLSAHYNVGVEASYAFAETTLLNPAPGENLIVSDGESRTISADEEFDNVIIETGGTLIISGTTTLTVTGNWTNDGSFTANNSTVIFAGNTNATISGETTSNFFNIAINKGSDITSIIDVNGTGTITNSGTLTISNGLFKITTGTFQFGVNANVNIPASGGVWINGATSTLSSTYSITSNGLFRITNGIANIGTISGNFLEINNGGGPLKAFLDIQDGIINITGRLYINNRGTLMMNDGIVNICTNGLSNSSNASFEVTATSHINTLSGGTIIFQNPNANTTGGDILISSGTGSKNITGGTFQIGNSSTPANSAFRINTVFALHNLIINSHNSPGIIISGNDLSVTNQLTLNGGNINTGSQAVILNNSNASGLSYTSGYIIGNFRRAISNSGENYLFPVGDGTTSANVQLNFAGITTAGEVTVTSSGTPPAGLALNSATAASTAFIVANNVGFSTVSGSFTPSSWDANQRAALYNGSTWSYAQPPGQVATFGTWTSLNGVAFALADCITPTITLDANPVICAGSTTAGLVYSATTGNPTEYIIDYDATAEAAGLSDIIAWTTLPASQIVISLPGALAAGTYTASLKVRNEVDCESTEYSFTINIALLPTAGITNNTGTTVLTCSTSTINVTATGGGTYSWSDGTNNLGTNAALVISNPGTYTVTVTSANGCTDTESITITQDIATPTAGITNNTGTTILTCSTTTINVTATGAGTYSWNDGTNVVGTDAALDISSPGTYTVTVTAANGCTATSSITITQDITPPTAGITNNTGTTELTCTTTAISVTATGGGTYAWSGGTTPGTAANSFTEPGTYTVTVTAANGCAATSSITITQNITPPTPGITNNTGTTELTCISTAISVTATGGVTYAWSGGATPETAENSFTEPGTYTVTVTAANGCTATSSITITQNITPPTAGITNNTGTTELTCTTTAISVTATGGGTYLWTGGTTPSAAANSFTAPGTYTVTVTTANGCTATSSITITQDITTPTAGITNNTGTTVLTCSTTTINVTATGVGTYSWSDGTNNLGTDAIINISTPGNYTVTVTAANGCTDTESITITQDVSLPNAGITNITGPTVLTCTTTSINVTATGGVTYSWSDGTNNLGTNAALTISDPGTYTVTVTAANGCIATASITITQDITPPAALAGDDRTIFRGQSTQIGSPQVTGSTYSWTSNPSGFTSSLPNPTVTPTATTTYTFTETSANGCQASNSVTVTITDNLTITKTVATTPLKPGDNIAYQISYSNLNTAGNAPDVVITDQLPPADQFTFLSASGGGVFDPATRTVTWNLGNVPANTSGTLTITGRVGRTGWTNEGYEPNSFYQSQGASTNNIINTAELENPTIANPILSEAQVTINQFCDLDVISYIYGEVFTASWNIIYYPITITNTGNITDKYLLTKTQIDQPLTSEIRDISGNVISETPWLLPNEQFTYYIFLNTQGSPPNRYNHTYVTATSIVCNTSKTTHLETFITNNNPGNAPNLVINKVGPNTVTAGSDITYTINVINIGQRDARNVLISDLIPPNVTYVSATSASSSVSFTDNEVRATRDRLGNGETIILAVVVRTSCSSMPEVRNEVHVSNTAGETHPENNTAVELTQVISNITPPVIQGTTICAGTSTTLTASGAPADHSYNWYTQPTGGTPVFTGNPFITPELTTTTSYYVSIFEVSDPMCESNRTTVTINVLQLPVITVHPQNIAVCHQTPGVNFTATITGTQLSYQWEVSTDGGNNWTELNNVNPYSGTSSPTLTISTATTVLNGYQYRLKTRSGTCSWVYSNPATLTVYSLPVCEITGGATTVCPNTTTVFTAPAGMSTYAWTIWGHGTISGVATQQTVTVTAGGGGNDCGLIFTLQLTITNADGCTSTCTNVVTVNDLQNPSISCPTPPSNNTFEVIVNSGNTYIHDNSIENWNTTATDNCGVVSLIAVLTDATTSVAPHHTTLNGVTFNEGTTTVTWTATDACGNTAQCSFQVEVIGQADIVVTKTVIEPIPAQAVEGESIIYLITVTNNGPAIATEVVLSDVFPATLTNPQYSTDGGITYQAWAGTLTYQNLGVGVGQSETILLKGDVGCPAVQNATLTNTSTVTLSAPLTDPDLSNNESSVTVSHIDNTPPTFNDPPTEPAVYCVINLLLAQYSTDLTLNPEPDYAVFLLGDETLDLDPTIFNFNDNCCASNTLTLHWRIEFSNTPDPANQPSGVLTHSDISGTDQPSAFGEIRLPGDGVNHTTVEHTIYYWLEDCNGNESPEKSRIIRVTPRPQIIKN